MNTFLLGARGTGCWFPSHIDKRVWMFFSFLETFMNMTHSHQNYLVDLNIPVIITCQGDILELGFDDCCLFLKAKLIFAEQIQLWWNMTYSISYKQQAIFYRQHSAYMKYFHDGQRPWWWTKYLYMDLLFMGRGNCCSFVWVGYIHVMMESALYTIPSLHISVPNKNLLIKAVNFVLMLDLKMWWFCFQMVVFVDKNIILYDFGKQIFQK